MNKTDTDPIGWCSTCGKWWYTDKARAKKVGRRHHPRKPAYICPVTVGKEQELYHVGSLPPSVVQGFLTRDQLRPRRDRSSGATTAEP
jgi:hypothetical protein